MGVPQHWVNLGDIPCMRLKAHTQRLLARGVALSDISMLSDSVHGCVTLADIIIINIQHTVWLPHRKLVFTPTQLIFTSLCLLNNPTLSSHPPPMSPKILEPPWRLEKSLWMPPASSLCESQQLRKLRIPDYGWASIAMSGPSWWVN